MHNTQYRRETLKDYSVPRHSPPLGIDTPVLLGSGKDGQTYFSKGRIFKKLSNFGKIYHQITAYLWEYLIKHEVPQEFVDLRINNEGYEYYSDPFEKVRLEEVPDYLIKYCDLQSKLLEHEIGITDMGLGLQSLNFMKDENEKLKWVDYGGITFCFSAKHKKLHSHILPRVLSQFEGIERRCSANKMNTKLMILFLCNQLDAIYNEKSKKAVVASLWEAKISDAGIERQYKIYVPRSGLSRNIWAFMRTDDWTSPETWQALKKAIKK